MTSKPIYNNKIDISMLFFKNCNGWKLVTYTVVIFYNKMVMCNVSDQFLSVTIDK